jgi:hypothetical protein
MKVALAAFGLLGLAGCVRATEGMVREQAASAFACADYALQVEEVGPDVYRASGCGQELIYACRPTAPPPADPRSQEVADIGDAPVMECARRP